MYASPSLSPFESMLSVQDQHIYSHIWYQHLSPSPFLPIAVSTVGFSLYSFWGLLAKLSPDEVANGYIKIANEAM